MNYTSYLDLRNVIKKNLSILQTKKFDLIVGIPRSGMVPAYIIAQYLNIKCCDLHSFIRNTQQELNETSPLQYPHDCQNVLLVDDCISSGGSMANSLEHIPENKRIKITTLAIYSSKKSRNDIDIFFEYHPGPGVSEWHLFHCGIVKKYCINIEGVLCLEPSDDQKTNNSNYIEYILNAPPLIVPSGKVNCLITNRPEKYRNETHSWLEKQGIEYDNLIMSQEFPEINANFWEEATKYKAHIYSQSKNELYVSYDKKESQKIHDLTRKPVYCMETNEIYSKGNIITAFHGSKLSKKAFVILMICKLKKLPKPVYVSLRSLYRFIS
ncbi:phosphoribosyltransferase [Salipaludibacillus keqinensis]|uniref:Phosphoribosyltransferase n=1 Tax=Salipaludibacillus keqinensis TaxID=2045207 RepID=A0A323TJ09_9BACI|nr:phosphoribosyltransferase family protein [Salipaludibacillus keqinensis]PYZ95082.1 phosphoribosyltransferase [Salipaludibacillus keqinensis]